MERDVSQNLIRASFAALACASGAVVTSAALVVRTDRSRVLAALSSGLALASAVFAVVAATRALANRPLPAPAARPTDAMRASLERISRIAQAGSLGDANAAQHAFAMIARSTRASLELLSES